MLQVLVGASMLPLQLSMASTFSVDPKCPTPGPVTLGCCYNTTTNKYESFSGGEYDELVFWDRRLIKNGSMNELPFLLGGYCEPFNDLLTLILLNEVNIGIVPVLNQI